MTLTFYKYQATGNDFVMIDNRSLIFDKNNTKLVAQLCHRRFGIGADGLILLENTPHYDFRMVYFNADGNESSMCGNGGRSIVAFAKQLGIIEKSTTFLAIDGPHAARIEGAKIHLKMQSVNTISIHDKYTILDTGSPHYIAFRSDVDSLDVKSEGRKIRYSKPFIDDGINVNFVSQLDQNTFAIRTYERGVEDETLSCGTGATAAAIAMHKTQKTNSEQISLQTKGGDIEVAFKFEENIYQNIWLSGAANLVFQGSISIIT
jgi:diaminopimelate epimerase